MKNWQPKEPTERKPSGTPVMLVGEKGERGEKGDRGYTGGVRIPAGVFAAFIILWVTSVVGIYVQGQRDYHSLLTKVAAESSHTAKVQKAGEPFGVCLREAMKAGEPIVVGLASEVSRSISDKKMWQSNQF